ncbi:AAA family ATPase [Bradyrhizobium japonicum]|uniref:3'-5' exonuclease n=1 Tax=Bradyrhizobium japonicum TaxID=375 RepID=UPI00200C03DE|nr:3'-5' exonuclease [Bradyrhizobium japonicum]UQD73475.1 AAA family ATPase [Bradyrhizobium japonicum]
MQLSRIVIKGYRSIALLDVDIKEKASCIVGENNTGKSNVVQALRLCLDVNLPSSYRLLLKEDVHCEIDQSKPFQVLVGVEFSDFAGNDAELAMLHGTQIAADRARLIYRFRPKKAAREAIEAAKSSGAAQPALTFDDYGWELIGGGDPAADIPKIEWDHDAEDFGASGFGFSYLQSFLVVYLPALRDVENDLAQARRSPLARLIQTSNIDVAEQSALLDAIKNANDTIEASPTIKQIAQSIDKAFKEVTGPAFSLDIELGLAEPSFFPRSPPMTSEGEFKSNAEVPQFIWGRTLEAITDVFLPELARLGIGFGEAAILARNWTALLPISQRLRDFGVPIVGPGARPYRRGRLFAGLAEQLSGAVLDGYQYRIRHLERALFAAIQDATGVSRTDIFSYDGRCTAIALVRRAELHAEHGGAEYWLDQMAKDTGEILHKLNWINQEHVKLFRASVADMKRDMIERNVDVDNMSIEDLGIFASPNTALRLLTIHNAKGHEYKAVALIGLRDGVLPDWRSQTDAAIISEKRLFYVGVTRAKVLLMYLGEPNQFGNPPCRFLGHGGVQMV